MNEPLFHPLQKGVPFEWSSDQEQSFNSLRLALTKAPVLINPLFDKPFILHIDASNVTIGAILSQCDAEQNDHPVAFYSKTLPKVERNYSIIEQEFLEVILAIKHFHTYLYGNHFTIITDHSLRCLQNMKNPDGRLAHWALRLQFYDF